LVSKPLFFESIGRMIGPSTESARDIGGELSPFLDRHGKEASQDLRAARGGTRICRITARLCSVHVSFEVLERRPDVVSDRFSPGTAIGEA